MTMAGGPVVSDDPGRRRAVLILGIVAALVVAVLGIRLVSSGGDPDDDTATGDAPGGVGARTGEAVASATESPPSETEATATPTTQAPAQVVAPTDLILTSAQPAFDAYAGIYGQSPVGVLEILLYTDYSFIKVQLPDQPTYVDEYEWRDGRLSGPEPYTLSGMETDELPTALFELSEIDPSVIPGVVQQALGQCGGQGLEPTHIIIDRFLPWDERVLIRVYTEVPERGSGGYVTFTPDGTLVEPVCS